jgi:hypothetical protein
MGLIPFRNLLESYRDIDLLEDKNGDIWLVRDLLDTFAKNIPIWLEDATAGFLYDSLFYVENKYIYAVSPEGDILLPPIFCKITSAHK